MDIRQATAGDAPALAGIYNDAVRHTTAIWNDAEVDADNRRQWLALRSAGRHPVLVAADGARGVVGYASFGDFRAFDGYRHTVEHSIYVRADARRAGVAARLMEALIAQARARGKHAMVGAIESENAASIALHRRLGFEEVGRMREVGTKFGRWLDLTWMQLLLDGGPPR